MDLMPVLAIDCGGTRTSGLLIRDGVLQQTLQASPANMYAQGREGVATVVAHLVRQSSRPGAVAAAVAGLRTEADRRELEAAIRQAGVGSPLFLMADAMAALRAAGHRSGIVLVAGTGSACWGCSAAGKESRAGGWGHVLGDEGSGYWIGREALVRAVRHLDEHRLDALDEATLMALGVEQDTIRSVVYAPDAKTRVASLARVVFDMAGESAAAGAILERGAEELARLPALVQAELELPLPATLVLSGGVFRSQPRFCDAVAVRVGGAFRVQRLERDPAWGAYELAMESNSWSVPRATVVTEARNARSANIDEMTTEQILTVMNEEDAHVIPAVRRAIPTLGVIVDEVARRLADGGRLTYVGAGTSGRLAMLDAVECVPTFGVAPDLVTALIAGGAEALTGAVEGAEDDATAGREAVEARCVGPDDAVLGISASGQASYVRAVLAAARERGAFVAALVCNQGTPLEAVAEVTAVLEVGPEVLAGSTRLKAGTAQKLALNMISTACMIRLGRTLGNRMIGVLPTNTKLRRRAVGLVLELSGSDEARALRALEECDWDVGLAVLALRLGSKEAAREAVREAGSVRAALRAR